MVRFEVSTGENDVTERCLEKFQNLPQTLRLRCRPDVEQSGVFYYFFAMISSFLGHLMTLLIMI